MSKVLRNVAVYEYTEDGKIKCGIAVKDITHLTKIMKNKLTGVELTR